MEPWEALDVDDSDLSSFLRPCKRQNHHRQSHNAEAANPITASESQPIFQLNPQLSPETLTISQSRLLFLQSEPSASPPRLIPGPAGALQAAMQRRARADTEELIPTQEFIRRVVENGDENDHDFNTNAWLCALDFLRRKGLADDDAVAYGTPLSSIKKNRNLERVGQVVAVIKSCTPNGLGDLMVTLKDPTSTIVAAVHRKVLTDGEFRKDICVGSVLVLQKVAVFSPTRSACYLNITMRNIVKVFSKNIGPPSEQIYPAPSVRRTAASIESKEKSWMLGNTLSLPQEKTEGIMSNLRLNLGFRERGDIDQQSCNDMVFGSSHPDHGNSRNQNDVLDRENLSQRQGKYARIPRPMDVTHGDELENEMEDLLNPSKLGEDNPACSVRSHGSTTNPVDISDGQETRIKNHIERKGEDLIPKGSIPQWTEEQLNELLAFD